MTKDRPKGYLVPCTFCGMAISAVATQDVAIAI